MIVDVIIPTYKPDEKFKKLVDMLERQTVPVNKVIVVNTEEKYMAAFCRGTHFLSEHNNMTMHHISRHEFDHGKSRNFGASKSNADVCVFMTQDAVPEDEFLIENLLEGLKQENVACAYARQLPDVDSTAIEKLTRSFNYPNRDVIKGQKDIDKLGIKTFFCSNVCCAYDMKIFRELGGFIKKTIFNEDMIYAGKAIQNGYNVVYASKARVIHAHNYTGKQQFKRNFDLGVSQAEHPEIFANISSESEGIKMVKIVIQQLREQRQAKEIFPYIYQTGCKFIGYRLGKAYKKLPRFLIMKCTMSPIYFMK